MKRTVARSPSGSEAAAFTMILLANVRIFFFPLIVRTGAESLARLRRRSATQPLDASGRGHRQRVDRRIVWKPGCAAIPRLPEKSGERLTRKQARGSRTRFADSVGSGMPCSHFSRARSSGAKCLRRRSRSAASGTACCTASGHCPHSQPGVSRQIAEASNS